MTTWHESKIPTEGGKYRPFREPRHGTGHGDAQSDPDDGNFVTDERTGLLIPAGAKKRRFRTGFGPSEPE